MHHQVLVGIAQEIVTRRHGSRTEIETVKYGDEPGELDPASPSRTPSLFIVIEIRLIDDLPKIVGFCESGDHRVLILSPISLSPTSFYDIGETPTLGHFDERIGVFGPPCPRRTS